MKVLGIESSCDETSVALVENGTVLKSTLFSQIDEHKKFGGVVPELASRAHLEKIVPLTEFVLNESKISLSEIDLIAVTDSPGLAGALLVGVSFGLGLHVRHRIPITGVNHLEGHIFSVFIENPDLQFPFLALVVSGGHTAIYKVQNVGDYVLLGETVDDAAGEAFDKVGKMIGFNYPAGQAIDMAAKSAKNLPEITFPVAELKKELNYSFSGLKTAVKYFLAQKGPDFISENRAEICRGFQDAVVQHLCGNLIKASHQTGIKQIALVGGVASNQGLRTRLQEQFGASFFTPSPKFCTDNAAMIAIAGEKRYYSKLTRFPSMNPSRNI